VKTQVNKKLLQYGIVALVVSGAVAKFGGSPYGAAGAFIAGVLFIIQGIRKN
jgi:hypothetical protein